MPVDLGRYYPEEYYALPTRHELDGAANGEAPRLALLRPFAADGPLVEVGAGLGIFSRAARSAGYEVTAIEMDARCCEYLEHVVGVRTICSDAPERALVDVGPSRAIVLWHVLEHLARPWEVLERAAECLGLGGVIALATPNPDSLQFHLLAGRWAHLDAPRHLFLIPFAALKAHMNNLGFDVASVTTSDPAGRHWNSFGWEYALRRHPSRRPSTRLTRIGSRLLADGLAPLERRGMNGTAYTAVFVKR
ncbi:MAG TPA: class I SAM-dependent methyltransferase [Solirubrobacteraceae bacterium]|nr:class I SAM-dependent methyltransferase [Solirubrobacteraceae bacterium]